MTLTLSRSRYLALASSTVGATVVLVAPLAHGQEQAVARVKDLNKKAVDAYENLDLDEARKLLTQALEMCASEGLNEHPIKALTHMNLGVVFVGGLKQKEQGIRQFKKALEIDSNVRLAKRLQNPEVVAAFDEAKKSAPPPTAAATKPAEEAPAKPAPDPEAPPAKEVKGIAHEPVLEAKPGEIVTIKAAVQKSLNADRVVLAYRPEGASDFLARDMEADGTGSYTARIPQVATNGATVAYYIEARDKAGKPLAGNGSAAEPHVISLTQAAVAAGGGAGSGGDEPGVHARADESGDGSGGPVWGRKKTWVALAIGGGGGWISGSPEVNPKDNSNREISYSGFAQSSLLHLAPEIGFQVSENLGFSLQARVQIVTGATKVVGTKCDVNNENAVCNPATGAFALLGRVTYLLGKPSAFRPFVAAEAGAGQIRHNVSLAARLNDCGADHNTDCIDTVASGVVLLGPSAGFYYAFSDAFAFTAGVHALAGVPKATVNFDVNAGIAAGF